MKRVNYPRIIGLSNDWQISWIHMLRGHEMLGRFPSSTGGIITVFDKLQNVSLEFHTIMFVTLIFPLFEISCQNWSKLHLYILEHAFQEKTSQSQNSMQDFEFSRTFFCPGSLAIAARRAEWQAYQ